MMHLLYRRNLDDIPENTQREMRKQAFIDRWPQVAELYAMGDELDNEIDRDIEANEPYEEVIIRWHNAPAIHEFFLDYPERIVGHYVAILITIDTLTDLVKRCEKILASGIDEDGELVDPQVAVKLLPTRYKYLFNPNDYDSRYVDDLKETVKGIKPIVDHPELYPDPIIYRALQ